MLSPFLHTCPIQTQFSKILIFYRFLNWLLRELVSWCLNIPSMYFQIPFKTFSLVIYQLIVTVSPTYNTRNKSKLRQPRSKYEYMYRNFSYRAGVYIWNKLQDHINIYSSYSTFIVYRPGYFTVHPPPAPSGPKFSNSENCCGSENAMPPKIFWDMEGHRGHFR